MNAIVRLLLASFLVWTTGCTLDINSFSPLNSLDPSNPVAPIDVPFGTSGFVRTNVRDYQDYESGETAYTIALQPDGKMLLAGSSNSKTGTDHFAIARANSNGTLDTTFADQGWLEFDPSGSDRSSYIFSVLLQSDGKIVLVGNSLNTFTDTVIARLNSDGSFDATFGSGGVRSMVAASERWMMGAALQADNKLVVVGRVGTSPAQDIVVRRFNLDGSDDTSWGGSGSVVTDTGANDVANAVVIQTDGKIVVGGYSTVAGARNDFVLFRYNTNGTLDTGFGTGGRALTDMPANRGDSVNNLALQADGKIVAAGWSLNYSGGNDNAMITRYNTNGSLDTSFGASGIVTGPVPPSLGNQTALAIQLDQKIIFSTVMSNNFGVYRYDTDGNPDTSFGGAGFVSVDFGRRDYATAAAIQSDGKIVVFGSGESPVENSGDFSVARLSVADGSLDATFGTAGLLQVGQYSIGKTSDELATILLQSDGKVVAVGTVTSNVDSDIGVVRYNADGSLDSSFGTGGKVVTDLPGERYVTSAALQADGKIVVGGVFDNGNDEDILLVRYNTNGTLDTSFGGQGYVTTDLASGSWEDVMKVVIQPDGKIVVMGSIDTPADDFYAARYNEDGSLDTDFNGTGYGTVGSSRYDYAADGALQPDGKILIFGISVQVASRDHLIARLNADGTVDTTFNGSGYVITDISASSNDQGGVISVQDDGKILVGGNTQGTGDPDFRMSLARYNSDGSLDSSFASGGKLVMPLTSNSSDGVRDIKVLPSGKILMAAYAVDGVTGFSPLVLVQLNADGSLDSNFGSGGIVSDDLIPGADSSAVSIALSPTGSLFVGGNGGEVDTDFLITKHTATGTR